MPRLSIIVPYRQHDLRLEATLLSILENRPRDCEVIVAHDGSYADPYQLDDEVIYVQEDRGCGHVRLINAGLMAACSPVVNVLLDGVRVGEDWAERPLELLSHPSTAAVAVAIDGPAGSHAGIIPWTRAKPKELMRGLVDQRRSANPVAGPLLACGFYRRKLALAVGGWNEDFSLATADVELAWLLQSLGLHCEQVLESKVEATLERQLDASALRQLAVLSTALGIVDASFTRAFADFSRGLLSGHLRSSLAWAAGLFDRPLRTRLAERSESAKIDVEGWRQSEPWLRLYIDPEADSPDRRAA